MVGGGWTEGQEDVSVCRVTSGAGGGGGEEEEKMICGMCTVDTHCVVMMMMMMMKTRTTRLEISLDTVIIYWGMLNP